MAAEIDEGGDGRGAPSVAVVGGGFGGVGAAVRSVISTIEAATLAPGAYELAA